MKRLMSILFSWKIQNSSFSVEQYFIAIASLLVAIVALVIALITYFSIESVNAISSMEGSKLEGELTYAENLYANVLKLMEKTNLTK